LHRFSTLGLVTGKAQSQKKDKGNIAISSEYTSKTKFYPVLCLSLAFVGSSEDDALLFWFLLHLKKKMVIKIRIIS
jgi:hypothetical protein